VAQQIDLAAAWNLLSEVHQEALALAVLDELTAPQAAVVLGISPVAFRLRLSRARRALRAHLDHRPQPALAPASVTERHSS
jgi:RNA polymerase sigma-70 factor, ECF subfamily